MSSLSSTAVLSAGQVGFDPYAAPETYEQFFAQYYGYIKGMVRKLGIEEQNTEDVAMAIVERFYDRDFLTKFDPDHKIEHRGTSYKPRFQSLLNSFVETYCRGHRDRQSTQARREPTLCDSPVGTEEDSVAWINVFGPSHVDDHTDIEERELVSQIQKHLATVPRRSPQDVCDLPRLFDLIVNQIRTEGAIDSKALMAAFGVSSTAIHSWLGLLRVQIRIVVADR